MKRIALVLLASIVGCASPAVKTSPAAPPAPEAKKADGPIEKRTEFVRNLHQRDLAKFSDACRIIQTLLDDRDGESPFGETRKSLIDKKVIPANWTYVADSPLTKGMISAMLCRSLGIKGGLIMWATGISERYGMRECVWIGIVLEGAENEYLSGKELLAIFTRAEIYKKHGDLKSIR